MSKRGAPLKTGNVYYLGRFRYIPGIHPPELRDLLEQIAAATRGRHQRLLEAALLGGMAQAIEVTATVEDTETANILDDMLGELF